MAPNNIQRTTSDVSDASFELMSKEAAAADIIKPPLPAISEVEDAKCECCGMSEECTPEYIGRVRSKFSGKMICGLCAEAVKEEMEKSGGRTEEAIREHMNACARFNRLGRAYPVLCQAEAMREVLKRNRFKSLSPKDHKSGQMNRSSGGIARSSSCMAAITKMSNSRGMVN